MAVGNVDVVESKKTLLLYGATQPLALTTLNRKQLHTDRIDPIYRALRTRTVLIPTNKCYISENKRAIGSIVPVAL